MARRREISLMSKVAKKWGYQLPPFKEHDGEVLNVLGYPVTKPGETQSEYLKRIFVWRHNHNMNNPPDEVESYETRSAYEERVAQWIKNHKQNHTDTPQDELTEEEEMNNLEDRKKKRAKAKPKRKPVKKIVKKCRCKK